MSTHKHLLAVAAMLAAGSAQAAPPISVHVNGRPVSFSGTPPTEMKGSVLVPLRGVFEALGASVNYDAASKTIYAQKGTANVVLPLGAMTATVNGQPQTLNQPAQSVGGTTLVPLRFVAQALGATVQWVAARSTVEITTAESHLSTLPAPASGSGSIIGLVTGVYTNTVPPQLTVRVNGQQTGVPVGADTIILRKAPGQAATAVALTDLKPGDQVTVQRDSSGNVVSITASYGEVKGTVKSVGRLASGNNIITLDDGTTVELERDAPVTMAGNGIKLSDVKPGETVVVRTNPGNNVGFGVAVVTGNNPNPTPPGQVAVSVSSIAYNSTRPLRAVDSLLVTLKGTPGGKASFSVPGLTEDVAMKETAPGVYQGALPVPKNTSVVGASVLGKLTANGQTAPLIQAGTPLTVDSRPPKMTDFSPANGATVENATPLIYASVSDADGTGINPDATRVSIDGKDVSAAATATPAFFNVKPSAPLAPGPHTVRASVTDNARNVQTAEWTFTVSGDKVVQSFTSSAPAGQPVSADTDLRFTLKAQPGGKASFSLGSLAKDVPMRETQPGVYVGSYIVRRGDNVIDAPATAKLTVGGQTVTAALSQPLTVAGGAASAPRILSPEDGANVAETVTVTGKAAPGATVRVSVTYVSKALGGLFAVNGSSGSTEVKADKNGNWKVDGLQLRGNSLLGNSRDTTFTISAATVDASGQPSEASKITVRRG